MYDRILLPTDGSDAATAATEHAIDLARAYDAPLYVLHVVDTRPYDAESITQSVIEPLEERGQRAVDEVVEAASAHGLDRTETAVVRGDPHETVLEYVDEHDIDLIVMATHGRSGVKRYLLGSVTEKIIRTAPVPVHVVRATETDLEDG
ncbi:universal stress protein [Natronococcus pandeyae]|uniref:Universal stress protein n=1 Tax=Natronococcus pandeyae TaxID=2055836 RepID=A0A8J8Q093_9EURY|nr:universal stress protein [Natronococcus pandeyae]TYL36917.1 universal stress protein [Natronococcus pandeyae]